MTHSSSGLRLAQFVLLAAPLGVGLALPLGAAQERRLNGPMGVGGDVLRYSICADGVHALYVADQQVNDENELYSVRLDVRSAPIKLNRDLTSGADVLSEVSSHDRVVYVARHLFDAGDRLYSVAIDGGLPVLLSPLFVSGGNVATSTAFTTLSPKITPDETRVVYAADQDVDGVVELFVVPIDASGPAVKLNHLLTGSWILVAFVLDPTGSTAVYCTATASAGFAQRQVWAVSLDGSSAPVQLADPGGGAELRDMRFSPDGQWVTYWFRPDPSYFLYHLYIVPRDASRPALRLDDNFPLSGGGFVTGAAFTATSDRVVMMEGPARSIGTQFDWLFSSTVDGAGMALATSQGDVNSLQIGPDGSTAFFASSTGLFRVPADGGATPTTLASNTTLGFAISADGSRVAYTARSGSTHLGVHSVPASGGTPTELHLPVPGEQFDLLGISADSRYVVYRRRAFGTTTRYDLFSASIDGSSAPRRLHDALPASRSVDSYQLASGPIRSGDVTYLLAGGRVVFSGDLYSDDVTELFVSYPASGESAPKLLAPPLQAAGR